MGTQFCRHGEEGRAWPARLSALAGVIAASCALAMLTGVQVPPQAQARVFMEQDTDRHGGDYKVMPLSREGPGHCAAQCAADMQCKSWTFVRAGIEHAGPTCRLKLTVPNGRRSPCCVSGVMVGSGTPASRPEAN